MSDASSRIQIRVIGQFELVVGDMPSTVPVQAQRVLGMLAVVGSPQSRTVLAGTLWRDLAEERAKANLRNALWRIHGASDKVMCCTRSGVGIDAGVTVDLARAQHCARGLVRGDLAVDDARMMEMFESDLLPAWDEDWLVIERERQRQLRMHALEELSAALCRVGRYSEAISAALAAVEAEPLRESSQRALVSAHVAEGNVSEAVRQLGAYRRQLAAEMGIAPSRQLQEIVDTALLHAQSRGTRSVDRPGASSVGRAPVRTGGTAAGPR